MNTKIKVCKLNLIKHCIFLGLCAMSCSAQAEYYVVFTSPSPIVECPDHYEKTYHVHHHYYHRHRHHHHKVHTTFAYHIHHTSFVWHEVPHPSWNLIALHHRYQEPDNFDMDRRTADDVGSDMDIDY